MKAELYTKKELIEDISEISQFIKSDTEIFFDAFCVAIEHALLNHKEVNIPNIGKFYYKYVPPKPEEKNVLLSPMVPGVYGDRPARPGYYRAKFRMSHRLVEKVKERTMEKDG